MLVKPNEWVKRVRPEPPLGRDAWSWEAFGEELGITQERIHVGRALTDRIESTVRDRGLTWKLVFRKGYVAFQRAGGYNALLVDVWWRKVPRFSVKVPQPPAELGLLDPYPELESSWYADEQEWGWTVPTVEEIPDVSRAIDLIRPFHPDARPMRVSADLA
ncbi:MAG: hypothetical protein ACRDL1_00895 [Solirubrobacterales bacterium]